MPTIVYNINFDSCQGCASRLQSDVNIINLSSLSSSNNLSFTTNTGSKSNYPFKKGKYYTLVNYPANTNITQDFITNWQFQNETYVYSENNILVPSLTGQTCPYKGDYIAGNLYSLGGYGYQQYSGVWKLLLTDENNISNFQVLVAPVTNWVPAYTGSSLQFSNFDFNTTALTYSNGSVTYSNPDYTY
jgi:hypothetical protein